MRLGSGGASRILAECRSYRDTTEMLAALCAIFSQYVASVDMGRAVRRVSSDGTIVPGPVTPDMMAQGRGLSVVV